MQKMQTAPVVPIKDPDFDPWKAEAEKQKADK
jgi:hypothetical protein